MYKEDGNSMYSSQITWQIDSNAVSLMHDSMTAQEGTKCYSQRTFLTSSGSCEN